MLARHLSVVHPLQVCTHVSQNISGTCIVLVSKMQANPGIDCSGASFLSIGSSSRHLSNFHSWSAGDIDGGPDGQCEGCCGRATLAAQWRERQAPRASAKAVEVAAAKEAGAVPGVVRERFEPFKISVDPVAEFIGGMRCGPAHHWVQAQLEVCKAGGTRWLQFFNGKRALRDVHSESSCNGTSSKLPMRWRCGACVPCWGVWRLPVREQGADSAVGRVGGAARGGRARWCCHSCGRP